MILSPEDARAVKLAIDACFPTWRQYPGEGAGQPSLFAVEIEGILHVIASAISNAVFGGGHLTVRDWWEPGGIGACLKIDTSPLDDLGVGIIPGFIFLHRAVEFRQTFGGMLGPRIEAFRFFQGHLDEYNAFFVVMFYNARSQRYPWSARPVCPGDDHPFSTASP